MYGSQHVLGLSGLGDPYGVAVDGKGDVYVADRARKHVYELTTAGVQKTLTAFDGLAPLAVAVDAAGDVFVADYDDLAVYELVAGTTTPKLLRPLSTPAFVQRPTGIAVDSKGDVFVSYYAGYVLELPAGSPAASSIPFNRVAEPYYGVAADAAGDVFVAAVADASIYEVKNGASTPTRALQLGYFPVAVAVDSAGDVFATDTNDSRVKELRTDGTTTTLPIAPLSPGKFSGYGLAIDAAGDVFVSDLPHHDVVELPRSTCSAPSARPRRPRHPGLAARPPRRTRRLT